MQIELRIELSLYSRECYKVEGLILRALNSLLPDSYYFLASFPEHLELRRAAEIR